MKKSWLVLVAFTVALAVVPLVLAAPLGTVANGAKAGLKVASGVKISQDNGAALTDIGGRRIAMYASGSSTGEDERSYSADKGSDKTGSEAQKVSGASSGGSDPSAAVPEQGSLFLLGAGLLGLALVLFWKSAGRAARPR